MSSVSLLALQSTAGNQAVERLLVQRALGVELEVTAWHVQHADGSRLPKGTEAAITDAAKQFVVSGDDDGDRSDIEFVSEAFPTRDVSDAALGRMKDLAQDMQQEARLRQAVGKERLIPAHEFKSRGEPNRNAFFDPGDTMNAHIQGTIAVPLELIPKLYGLVSAGGAGDLARGPATKALEKMDAAGPKPALSSKGGPSGQLEGFLLLVVDYIVQGFVPLAWRKGAHEQFPKSLFNILAKTRFDKMLSLVPEYEELVNKTGQMKDEWIDWIVQAALGPLEREELAGARKDRVLSHTFGEADEDPYTVDVSREEWLSAMPSDDLLSQKHDPKHLQGMGAFGGGTDKLVPNEVQHDLASRMGKQLEEQELAPEDKGKGPSIEPIATPKKSSASGASAEAPIFELRKVEIQGGAPDSWAGNVKGLWDLHDKVLGDLQYHKVKT